MSRENTNIVRRCTNCGGRLRVIRVTRINRFQTPEASLYDSNVSRYKKKSEASAQELMCTCCGRRFPLFGGITTKSKKKKQKLIKEVVKQETNVSKKRPKVKVKRVVRIVKFLIFLAALAAVAYFAYQYKDILIEYWESLVSVLQKIQDLVAYIVDIFK